MNSRSSLGFFALMLLLVAAAGAVLWSQRLQTLSLRAELVAGRAAAGELAGLRAENQRLREKQITAAQLEALRADHAALPRLRAQVEALKKPPAP